MIKNKTICKAFSDINRFESQREVFIKIGLNRNRKYFYWYIYR